MAKKIDLTGQRFGRWTVLHQAESRRDPRGRSVVYWHCLCDCGNERDIQAANLKKGDSQSCGCYNDEIRSRSHKTHGMRRSRLYNIRAGMIQRCNNPNNPLYRHYGGRGIKVCDEWSNSFEAFRDWALANGYEEHLTIDRIDNGGNYEPSNCRWVSMKTQSVNRRNTTQYSINGETKSLREWCEMYGVSYNAVHHRLKRGWSIEKALNTPV